MELRLILIFAVGLVAGAVANWLIYTVAFNPRPIGPWKTKHPEAPERHWSDRIPVIGWWNLRRESSLHGRGYWIRPLLIEVGLAAFLVVLYRFETSGGFLPFPPPPLPPNHATWFNILFVFHGFLTVLLTVATFIDFDEQTIPDWITFPGTVIGLIATALTPQVFLPKPSTVMGQSLEPVLLNSPNPWDERLAGSLGLWVGLFIVAGWCFALADRRWITRRGYKNAAKYFFAGLARDPFRPLLIVTWIVVSLGVLGVWWWGGVHWQGMLTGLAGLAIGGGVVWSVRLIAGWAMQTEAMGFGDVILLGMIGVYLGWQAAVVTFFAAPLTAAVIVLVYYFVTGEKRVAFGPYLCAAALLVIFRWSSIWGQGGGLEALFAFPALLLTIFVFGLGLMAIIFKIMRLGQGS